MWKPSVAVLSAALSTVLLAASIAAHAQAVVQPPVHWELQVIRDGQTIDTFDATTTVGQAYTATHHDKVVHDVGCKDQPAGNIDLSRTLTVSPTAADPGEVTLSIDAQETLESDDVTQTTEGCKLPPQPREVSASHPGLMLPMGEWVTWTIIDKNPTLAYRVRASLAPLNPN
jgi:hypothetical protein